jgi:hypothetical protein
LGEIDAVKTYTYGTYVSDNQVSRKITAARLTGRRSRDLQFL